MLSVCSYMYHQAAKYFKYLITKIKVKSTGDARRA